jgi:predicted MPP superfamily phosphohydrolase
MGNHEFFIRRDLPAMFRDRGIRYLENSSTVLKRENESLKISAVEFPRSRKQYPRLMKNLRDTDMFQILLAHDPEAFPYALPNGYPLVFSGHTHGGGQIRIRSGGTSFNIAGTRYDGGLYHEGNSTLYVSRGIGVTGLPFRIGAPPEITIVRLNAGGQRES